MAINCELHDFAKHSSSTTVLISYPAAFPDLSPKEPDNRVEVYLLIQCGRRDDVLYVDERFVFGQKAHLNDT